MKLHHFLTLAAAIVTALPTLPADAGGKSDIARGAYLINGWGCADCHMPLKIGPKGPEPDVARGMSGHPEGLVLPSPPAPQGPWIWGGAATNTAFYGPWGVSYAINLTPDPQTGLGPWTADQFIAAMKTGKHVGTSRPILPPMPWQSLSRLTDGDLRAMFAYLKSLPPVRNAVPAPQAPQ